MSEAHVETSAFSWRCVWYGTIGYAAAQIHSGDLLAYRKEAFRLRDACRNIYDTAEEHIRRKLKTNDRVRRPPTFACLAQTQVSPSPRAVVSCKEVAASQGRR
jgi:hypothetical protein